MPRSPRDPHYSGPEALRAALRWGHDFAGWEMSGLLQDLDRQREHIETVIAGENPRVAADWLFVRPPSATTSAAPSIDSRRAAVSCDDECEVLA